MEFGEYFEFVEFGSITYHITKDEETDMVSSIEEYIDTSFVDNERSELNMLLEIVGGRL